MQTRNMMARLATCAFLLMSTAYGQAQEATAPLTVSASATSEVPEKLKSGDLRIAVVRQINSGDFYEQWMAGAQQEADHLGVKLDIYNANGDNARQALMLEQAVATQPDAIVLALGFGETLKPGIAAAQAANIPVVAFYVEVEPSANVVTIDQGDTLMMDGVLKQFAQDLGGGELNAKVIYVYVPGYQALDTRHTVWADFLEKNPGVQSVGTIGVVNSNTAAQTADQTKAMLTANRDVKAIIAPFNEFAKGASLGIEELGMQKDVKVYGIDISTADIAVMTKPDSPWVATGTTDPSNVGAVVLRAATLKAVGHLEGETLSVPPTIVTQAALLKDGIQNMEQLAENFPSLKTPQLLKAPWMDSMK